MWRWAAAAPSTVLVLLALDLFWRFDGYFAKYPSKRQKRSSAKSTSTVLGAAAAQRHTAPCLLICLEHTEL